MERERAVTREKRQSTQNEFLVLNGELQAMQVGQQQ